MKSLFMIGAVLAVGAIAQALAQTPAQTPSWQSLDSIAAAARSYVEARGVKFGARQSIEVGPLDERLRYSSCPQPLAAAFAPGASAPPRMTVEVRCPVPPAWKLYVPVKISAFDRALVVTRALERGHALSAADVAATDSPMRDLPAGYISDATKITGLRLSRPVSAGTVITASLLEIDPIIRLGDRVTAVAQVKGIAVRTQAIALASAGANQRIKLKNVTSGRQLEGIVREKNLVEISVH